jgi:hypothetical protein
MGEFKIDEGFQRIHDFTFEKFKANGMFTKDKWHFANQMKWVHWELAKTPQAFYNRFRQFSVLQDNPLIWNE